MVGLVADVSTKRRAFAADDDAVGAGIGPGAGDDVPGGRIDLGRVGGAVGAGVEVVQQVGGVGRLAEETPAYAEVSSQVRSDFEIVLREGFMLPRPDVGSDVGRGHRKAGNVAQQEGGKCLLEGAGAGGRARVGEAEATLLAGGVFRLV